MQHGWFQPFALRRRQRGPECLERHVDRPLHANGLGVRQLTKPYRIACAKLSNLPKLRLCDDGRTDKSAETGSIRSQQDRHIASEVEGSNGIRVVVKIRGMESRF